MPDQDNRLTRREMSVRGLAAGMAEPMAGALAVTEASPRATPVASGRQAIDPRELFSGAIVANGIVFTSGALGINPDTRELAGEDITAQSGQALANLEATLTAAGTSLDRVVKSTCFLASLDDFEAFNEVYKQAFPSEPPARSTVRVAALALGALVETEFVTVI